MQLLLIVEDCFDLARSQLGLAVMPEVPMEVIPELKPLDSVVLPVMLKFPDGTSRKVPARFRFPHFNPGGFKKVCHFEDLKKENLPIGTEIWLID